MLQSPCGGPVLSFFKGFCLSPIPSSTKTFLLGLCLGGRTNSAPAHTRRILCVCMCICCAAPSSSWPLRRQQAGPQTARPALPRCTATSITRPAAPFARRQRCAPRLSLCVQCRQEPSLPRMHAGEKPLSLLQVQSLRLLLGRGCRTRRCWRRHSTTR